MSKKTIELFLENDYQKEFTAEIVASHSLGLVFNQTLFYPTGGHQAHDEGQIILESGEKIDIIDVMKDKTGIIYHKIKDSSNSSKIEIGQTIKGRIDWKRRYYHMRLHTAQHLISQIVYEMFQIKTLRSNFDYNDTLGGLIKIEKSLQIEDWYKIETEALKRIEEDMSVNRKKEGHISEILIDNKSPNKCGGTHIKKLGEIENLRITRVEGDKIYYDITPRLKIKENEIIWQYHDAMSYIPSNLVNKSGQYLKELHQRVEKLDIKNKELKELLINSSISSGEANEVKHCDTNFVFIDLSFLQAKEVKSLFKEYQRENCVYLALGAKKTLCVQSFSKKIAAKELFNLFRSVKAWELKGGGNKEFAQGGQLPDEENILEKVKELALSFEF